MKKEKTLLVTPGLKIGTIEEYMPKRGAYEDKDGNIRSLFLGKAVIDIESKDLVILPFKKMKLINIGDSIIGRITNFSGFYALVDIFAVNTTPLDRKFNGTLHPPKVIKDIKDIYKLYKLGDYIYAKVISKLNRTIHLSVSGRNYGVIMAYCSNCGVPLIKEKENNKLKCPKCKNIEERKISKLYGEVI